MRVFSRRIKRPFDVPAQCPHDADARQHRRAVAFRDQDQGLHCGLPFGAGVLGLRELGDIIAGILERDELATARQQDRVFERTFPALAAIRIWTNP
jgi:hypothetical protein